MPRHFFIVGVQRCGTTYLYSVLDAHPEIEMAKPLRPEPKFFLEAAKFELGLDYYERTYFSSDEGEVRGEKGTSYIESRPALRRMAQMLPDAQVVVLLRDPARRAISHYRFSSDNGVEDLPLSEALRASIQDSRAWDRQRISVSPYSYLPRGEYDRYLEHLTDAIPKEQVSILLLEELLDDSSVLTGLYAHLGVDPSFRPGALGEVVNASSQEDVTVDPGTEAFLRSYYREPNRRLSALLGRGLPWPS